MELDVTHMVDDADDMMDLSGSRMEHGQDAGRITWNNSVAYGKDRPLLTTDEMRDAARAHFREYGAWSEEEIDGWSEDDLQGITCQDVAAAIREMEPYEDYEDYESYIKARDGGGRLYPGGDGRWYFYFGS
jgi:phage pi2 protein 07